jgi:hypothetical protein
LAHPKTPALELVAVEPLDSLCASLLLGEFNKGKTSCAAGVTVDWQGYLCHVTDFRKKSFKIVLRRIVAQVPNKNLGANDDLLTSGLSTTPIFLRPTLCTLFSIYWSFGQLYFKK